MHLHHVPGPLASSALPRLSVRHHALAVDTGYRNYQSRPTDFARSAEFRLTSAIASHVPHSTANRRRPPVTSSIKDQCFRLTFLCKSASTREYTPCDIYWMEDKIWLRVQIEDHIDRHRRVLSRPIWPVADSITDAGTIRPRELTVCTHTQTRTLYVRTRIGSNTSRVVNVGQLCECGKAFIS